MESNGVVTWGSPDEILGDVEDTSLPEEADSDNSASGVTKQNLNESASGDGKLILAEELVEGHVGWDACKRSSFFVLDRSLYWE